MKRKLVYLIALVGLWLGLSACGGQAAPGPLGVAKKPEQGFVYRQGPNLRLGNRPFHFAGTNNYYLMYRSPKMVDAVLEKAAASDFNTVRTWGFFDIGNQDGSNSTRGPQEGVYFHYWDGEKPAYNDGPNGLERLDYVVAKAGELGLKLIIPLTNNWADFGGMDQYVRWAGGQYHDDFYRDPEIRQWYKDWASHLLNRVNTLTGVAYKDDPTIAVWELANEPRCGGSGTYPRSESCDSKVLGAWVAEMSAHLKRTDPNHLVATGDEGFFCEAGSDDWTRGCGDGVDTVAFAALPTVDLMSFHLYPDHWGKDAAWSKTWINDHARAAARIAKPVVLGEFGWHDKATRNTVYKSWTDAALKHKLDGMLYWILSDMQDDGTLYPDYDGFTVYCPSPVCTALSNFSLALTTGARHFAPVADHDTATTPFDTPFTLTPLANDIAYQGSLESRTLDLDPTRAGRQAQVVVSGKGSFVQGAGGTVVFTPAAGFVGKASASYTVTAKRVVSSAATLTVTVQPSATGAVTLYGFETGTDGWAPASWEAAGGSVAQSSSFASEGSSSLEVTATGGGWFGLDFAEPLDLSSRSGLEYDLRSGGTSPLVALKIGPNGTWCQYSGSWVGAGTTTVIETAWDDFGCSTFDPSDIRGLFIYFNGGGTSHIDNVRAE